MNNVYDNWERLVGAVLRREELWKLARAPSLSSTSLSSTFSFSSPSVSRHEAENKTGSVPSTRKSLLSRIFLKVKEDKQKVKFLHEDDAFLKWKRLSGGYLTYETIRIFSAPDIWRATNKYDNRNIIDCGAYGTVYKGTLPDSRVVAIKKLEDPWISEDEAISEVIAVSNINHPNVMKLLGCCLEKEAHSLVYEFTSNGSLRSHIDNPILAANFSWEMRIKVAAEIAGALVYLESAISTPYSIFSKEISTRNIFVDDTYTAKVIDFGSSRFVSNDHPDVITLQRTFEYMHPDELCLHAKKMTERCDVFRLGVVLAELLTGKKPISYLLPKEERNLAPVFLSAVQQKRLVQILDSNLAIEDRIEQLTRVAKLSVRCLRRRGEERPSMKEVAMELEALRYVQNHRWSDGDLNEEETLDSFSDTASPSNSDDYLVPNETTATFTADELRMATDNYNRLNIIGRGDHERIHKGILPNYGAVAIKKSIIRSQGQMDKYISEIKVVSQINHQNAAKLLGYCLETGVPLLVYEFIKNGTLYSHIHDPILASSFSWEMRIKVAAETAGALAYLHSVSIIHGDIKTANILLDQNYTAKVFYYGASRFHHLENSAFNLEVQGSIGYLDPEYLQFGQLTKKSDVYSFGVVLAELLTAEEAISYERAVEDRILSSYFSNAIRDDRLLQIVDKNLVREDQIERLKRVAKLIECCIKPRQQERPSMEEVAMKLEALFVTILVSQSH